MTYEQRSDLTVAGRVVSKQGSLIGSMTAMPQASAGYNGLTVLYLGEDTGGFVSDTLYTCVENSGTYTWEGLAVGGSGTIAIGESLSASGWVNKAQTISIQDLLADDIVIPVPDIHSMDAYRAAGVRAVSQMDGSVTFECDTVPTEDLSITMLIITPGGSRGGGGGTVVVDEAMSDSSTNPVQNRVITSALGDKADKSTTYTKTQTDALLDEKQDVLSAGTGISISSGTIAVDADTAPTAGSSKPATSGGIKTALDAKQDSLEFDSTPRTGSTNPVTSAGIYDAINTAIAGAYKVRGTRTVAQINALTGMVQGDVYNVSDGGTITGDVVVAAGDNVVWTGTAWDKLAATIDISGKQNLLTAGEGIAIDNDVISVHYTEAPYYTKAQVDTAVNAKQDALTAGDGIIIENDVISVGWEGPTTYHYVSISAPFMDEVTVSYTYVDENGEPSAEIASYFPQSTVVERTAAGYLKYWFNTTGIDTLTFNGGPDSVETIETDEGSPLTPHVYTDAASLYASYDAKRGPGFASAELMWDCLTCPNIVLAGETFDPSTAVPDPSEPATPFYTKAEADALLDAKQDAPSVAGTAGQVISLDTELNPVWITPEKGAKAQIEVTIGETMAALVTSKSVEDYTTIVASGDSGVLGTYTVQNGLNLAGDPDTDPLKFSYSSGDYIWKASSDGKVGLYRMYEEELSTEYGTIDAVLESVQTHVSDPLSTESPLGYLWEAFFVGTAYRAYVGADYSNIPVTATADGQPTLTGTTDAQGKCILEGAVPGAVYTVQGATEPQSVPYVRITNPNGGPVSYTDGSSTLTINGYDVVFGQIGDETLHTTGGTPGTLYADATDVPGAMKCTVYYDGSNLIANYYSPTTYTVNFSEAIMGYLSWTITPGYDYDTLVAMFSCTTVIGPDDPAPSGSVVYGPATVKVTHLVTEVALEQDTPVVVPTIEERLAAVDAQLQNKADVSQLPAIFTDVQASTWTADSTYADYGYRASLPLSGVTANDVAWVTFDAPEATSGDYAPVCATYDGGVYIYAATNTSITIPTITIFRRQRDGDREDQCGGIGRCAGIIHIPRIPRGCRVYDTDHRRCDR